MADIHYGRKRKGMVRELNTKIEDWLASIDDEDVASAVKKDTIITGGSIASMLLGEKINDFDVYFRTKETAVLVARYYVAKFNATMKSKSGDAVLMHEPYVTENSVKNCKGTIEDRVLIYIKSAGVAAEDQNTYQYFEMQPEEAAAAFAESLDAAKSDGKAKYRPVFLSANAITLSNDVQLIIRFFGEPDKIHDNFDFKHAMSYYDYGSKQLVLPAAAMECLLSRSLVYAGSLYPICSIFRMKKFLDRGWRISAGEMLKIMWQISELDLKDQDMLREQLTGVDMAYMHELIAALKDVSADKINSTYIAEIIDRIFN
jgi:hypothetical protein